MLVRQPANHPLAAHPQLGLRLWIGLGIWLAAAAVFASSGFVRQDRVFIIAPILAFTTIALVALYLASARFAAAIRALDSRVFLAFHTIRLPIGMAFLWMAGRGELDPVFATRGGYGDIIAGGLAAVLAIALTLRKRVARGWLLAWNVFALLDILMVVMTAQSILLLSDHPETMMALARLPWLLLPTFVVPIVISTHIYLFGRWGARANQSETVSSAHLG